MLARAVGGGLLFIGADSGRLVVLVVESGGQSVYGGGQGWSC